MDDKSTIMSILSGRTIEDRASVLMDVGNQLLWVSSTSLPDVPHITSLEQLQYSKTIREKTSQLVWYGFASASHNSQGTSLENDLWKDD